MRYTNFPAFVREWHEHLSQPALVIVFPKGDLINQPVDVMLTESIEPPRHLALVEIDGFLEHNVVRGPKAVTIAMT